MAKNECRFSQLYGQTATSARTTLLAAAKASAFTKGHFNLNMTVLQNTLLQHVPFRRWVEIFACDRNAPGYDALPPSSPREASLARTFINETRRWCPADSGNILAIADLAVYMIYDLAFFPVFDDTDAAGLLGPDELRDRLVASNRRKGLKLRMLVEYRDNPGIPQSLWMREKQRAPLWAMRVVSGARREVLQSWLKLAGPDTV